MIDRREQITPDPLLDRSLYYGASTLWSRPNCRRTCARRAHRRPRPLLSRSGDSAARRASSWSWPSAASSLSSGWPGRSLRVISSIAIRGIRHQGLQRTALPGQDRPVAVPHPPARPDGGVLHPGPGRSAAGDLPAARADRCRPSRKPWAATPGPSSASSTTSSSTWRSVPSSPRPRRRRRSRSTLAITRCLEHRWPEVYVQLTTSDHLAEEVACGSLPAWPALRVQVRRPGSRSYRSDQRLAALLLSDRGRLWLPI